MHNWCEGYARQYKIQTIMNEAEIYLLANDLTLYYKLQSLGLLDPVTEIMQSFIEGEKESYEIGIGALQEDIKDLEEQNEALRIKILKLSAPKIESI